MIWKIQAALFWLAMIGLGVLIKLTWPLAYLLIYCLAVHGCMA